MTQDTAFYDEIAKTVLSLSEEMAFSAITLPKLAARMGRPVSDFLNLPDLNTLVVDYLDRACAAEPVDETESLRERLFDIAMLRFEAMEDYRDGVMAWQDGWLMNPIKRAKAAKRRVKSARWILTLAGETQDLFLKPKSVVLSGILFRAEQAWRKEEGEDFTRTMAQLDRDLRDIDSWVERFGSFSFGPFGKKKAADFSAAV